MRGNFFVTLGGVEAYEIFYLIADSWISITFKVLVIL